MSIKKSQYAAPAIPMRFRFTGDVEKGKALMGFARQQFARSLEIDGANRYNKHLIVNRKWPTLRSNYGELVSIQMIKGASVIDIHVPLVDGGKVIVLEKACFCDCNFSLGHIKSSTFVNGLTYYSVIVCKKDLYNIYENILASDFTPWEEDMTVVLMAYNEMLFDCDKANANATGCLPIEDEGTEIGSEYWRTTLRIVPVCFLNFAKWLYYDRPVR